MPPELPASSPWEKPRPALSSARQEWGKGSVAWKKIKKGKTKQVIQNPLQSIRLTPKLGDLCIRPHLSHTLLWTFTSQISTDQDIPTFCISNATMSLSLKGLSPQAEDAHENGAPYKQQHGELSWAGQLCKCNKWGYVLCQAMVPAPGLQPPRLHPARNHLFFQVIRAATDPLKCKWRQVRNTHHMQLMWIC